MFCINEDMSIYATRGDMVFFRVTAEENGNVYKFQAGDVVRFKVTEKKACEEVVLQKDFAVTEETEAVEVILTKQDTKIGDVISKPVDYWYEVELNSFSNPQTIIGYDEDGARIFKLFPEGMDEASSEEISEEDIPIVDSELDLTSERPVENRAIARAITELMNDVAIVHARFNNFATLKQGSTSADAELADIRVGTDGEIYSSAGNAVRKQISRLTDRVTMFEANLNEPVRAAAESAETAGKYRDETELLLEAVREAADSAGKSETEIFKAVETAKKYNENTAELIQNNENTMNALLDCAKEYNEQTADILKETNKRLGMTEFELSEDGYLLYTDDTAYVFEVDDKGQLNYEVAERDV